MSTKNKKTAPTGIRYTDAQKKEVVDFVAQYNSNKGRGGQSAAAKKYKVTPLTIAAWIKAFGAKKAKKAAPAAKPAKPAKVVKTVTGPKNKKGMRYSAAQKQEVVDFVTSYNAANGRGGQSHAAAKFGLSVLTVSSWLKKAGTSAKSAGRGAANVSSSVPAGLAAKVASLIAVGEEIRKAEITLNGLRAKYDSLKSSIQSSL